MSSARRTATMPTRSSTFGTGSCAPPGRTTRHLALTRCSMPTCQAYCVSLLSSGSPCTGRTERRRRPAHSDRAGRAPDGVPLHAGAEGDVGVRPHADRLLEIERGRGLREIVAVDRRIAEVLAAIRVVDRSGRCRCRRSACPACRRAMCWLNSRGVSDRSSGRLEAAIEVGPNGAEEAGLLFLVAHAAVDDQFGAGPSVA